VSRSYGSSPSSAHDDSADAKMHAAITHRIMVGVCEHSSRHELHELRTSDSSRLRGLAPGTATNRLRTTVWFADLMPRQFGEPSTP
jgi:hypothetical protein